MKDLHAKLLKEFRSFARLSSWPLRQTLACGLSCLINLEGDNKIFGAKIFAPLVSLVCITPHLGSTLKTCEMAVLGLVVAAILGFPMAFIITPNLLVLHVLLTVSSILILLPSLNPLTAKLALVILTVLLTSAREDESSLQRQCCGSPLQDLASAAAGLLAALVVALLPLPGSRARNIAESTMAEAETNAANAAALLCHSIGAGRSKRAILAAHAQILIVKSVRCQERVRMLLPDVSWELHLFALLRFPDRLFYSSMEEPSHLIDHIAKRLEQLSRVDAALFGILRCLNNDNYEDSVVASWSTIQRSDSMELQSDFITQRNWDGWEHIAAVKALHISVQTQLEVLRTGIVDATENLGQVFSELAVVRGYENRLKIIADLEQAVKLLDRATYDARKKAFYSSGNDHTEQAIAALGPPTSRLFLLFCIMEVGKIWTDISPPVRAPKSLISDRIRSMWIDFSRSRILYVFKLTLAINLALAAGIYCTGSGMWAAVAVCMVGPRSLMEVGGSFRAAKLRLSGTGGGAIFAAVVMILVQSVTLEIGHFLLILPWVFVMGYLRHNVSIAYGAFIAQVTPFLMMQNSLISYTSVESWVYRRISQNFLGVIIYIAIEVLIKPVRALSIFEVQLGKNLRNIASAIDTIMHENLGALCCECRSSYAQKASSLLSSLYQGMKMQKNLMFEVYDEPSWLMSSAIPPRAVETFLEKSIESVDRLLGIMQMVLSNWTRECADSPEDMAQFLFPLKDPLLKLKSIMVAWYESLAERAESHTHDSRNELKAIEISSQVHACVTALEKQHASACAKIIKSIRSEKSGSSEGSEGSSSIRDKVPTNDTILPLSAILYCTRALSKVSEEVAFGMRELSISVNPDFSILKDHHNIQRGNLAEEVANTLADANGEISSTTLATSRISFELGFVNGNHSLTDLRGMEADPLVRGSNLRDSNEIALEVSPDRSQGESEQEYVLCRRCQKRI
mmetsp:Transcript_15765/g.52756  ORF Transcript_15765/g.52756 Transcript_15765/m.52756 type:complete len:968 (-) Transcript_15765:61-2964(-)